MTTILPFHVRRWIAKHRLALITPVVVFATFCYRWEWEVDWLVWTLGPFCVVSGVGLRIWSQEHIHRRLDLPDHLTTTGPYAIMRNPLYVANTLIIVGAVILSELVWLAPVMLAWSLLIFSISAEYEETQLLRRYGNAYRKYMQTVSRWQPTIPARSALGGGREYFRAAMKAEGLGFALIVPFLLKEFAAPWFEH